VSAHLLAEITVLVLAAFVGFEVISKVPTTLHTPLMSGTNAIHGIVIVGGMLTVALASSWWQLALGTIAVAFGTINVVGGFLVTDRMLEMFRERRPAGGSNRGSAGPVRDGGGPARTLGGGGTSSSQPSPGRGEG
jgi:NAD(P) transhydrogenase subunit alpha